MAENRVNVVLRHKIADYLNIGTSEEPNWVLMGTGFTSLNENPGAQSESVKYINSPSSSSTVTSYETSFDYEAEHVADEAAIDDIYQIARNHYTGSDAQREYCRVELWNAEGDDGKTFSARKFLISCEVSSYSGENKQNISGNLNAVGDPVLGTFNVATKAFVAAEA